MVDSVSRTRPCAPRGEWNPPNSRSLPIEAKDRIPARLVVSRPVAHDQALLALRHAGERELHAGGPARLHDHLPSRADGVVHARRLPVDLDVGVHRVRLVFGAATHAENDPLTVERQRVGREFCTYHHQVAGLGPDVRELEPHALGA